MTWTKISDDFPDECASLTVNARWLHLEGLVWSNRKLLDCVIPKDHLRRLAEEPQFVSELLATGFWTEEEETYTIRHHQMHALTRDQVLKRASTSRSNGKLGGRPKAGPRGSDIPGTQRVSQPGTQPGSATGSAKPSSIPARERSRGHLEPNQVSRPATQGDRPGQDRSMTEGLPTEPVRQPEAWPSAAVPGSSCAVCGRPMTQDLVGAGETSHPDCEGEAA